MSAIAVCDGCGKQATMQTGQDSHWYKPRSWFERTVYENPDGGIGELGRVVEILTACDYDPLWYDCDKHQCADCPWGVCRGCGHIRVECGCDIDLEYEEQA